MRKIKWSILAGIFGNIFEWYDFILYAYFTPLFATLFFPNQNPSVALIATLGIFASGFIVRPLGGILLGYIGDKSGRRRTLIISLLLMNFATLLIACLPTYSQIGISAPILLAVFRMMQGMAVGGELTESATFLMEHAPAKHRGLIGSLALGSAFLGMVIGSAVTTLLNFILTKEEMLHFGWRIPYFIGILFGLIGIYIRMAKSDETPYFLARPRERSLVQSIYQFKKTILLLFIFTSVLAVGNYHLIAYINTFLIKFNYLNYQDTMLINFLSLSLLTILIPLFGWMSDKIGRKQVLLIGFLGVCFLAVPIFWLIAQGKFLTSLYGEFLLALTLAPLNAVIPVVLIEQFPTQVRATGSSLTYNVSQAIFGGTTPLVSFMLVESTGVQISPGIYLLFFALIALLMLPFFNWQVLLGSKGEEWIYESANH